MKFTVQLATLITLLAFAGSAVADGENGRPINCKESTSTTTTDVQGLIDLLHGVPLQKYTIDGWHAKEFGKSGTAKAMLLTPWSHEVHSTAEKVANVLSEILDKCCTINGPGPLDILDGPKAFEPYCCGDTDADVDDEPPSGFRDPRIFNVEIPC